MQEGEAYAMMRKTLQLLVSIPPVFLGYLWIWQHVFDNTHTHVRTIESGVIGSVNPNDRNFRSIRLHKQRGCDGKFNLMSLERMRDERLLPARRRDN